MCGIAGLFSARGALDRGAAERLLRRMNDALAHRGPDGDGVHVDAHAALGHRRLAIIDLAGGHQPLYNEDGSVCVVFNGEIYNYLDLVPELEALGHVFRTRSDTEVIVHAWEAWGVDCLARFRGMFAFALWDRRQRVLFLARDRLGVKPLYYGFAADGTLAFGSELKAVRLHDGIDRALDESAIEDYFAYGYVPDPKSIHAAIRKLPPAHYLLLRAGQAPGRPVRYWDLDFAPDRSIDAVEAQERARELVRESVRLRMIADVPLGAFLSGGVDSSVVVATMTGLSSAPVKTCAIGFDVAAFDETEYAQRVARDFATDHVEERVGSDDFALIDLLDGSFDEPFADGSALPMFRVCESARKRVTVALSGDGGDEGFGGYRRYRMHLAEERVRQALPAGLRHTVFGGLARIYPKADWAPQMLRAKTTFQSLALGAVDAYHRSVCFTVREDRRRMFSPAFNRRLGGYDAVEVFRDHAANYRGEDPLGLLQHLDIRTWLPGDINTKVDRTSMRHSLEVREPLLDHRLLEWAATLPATLKVSEGQGKWLLKKAYERDLPEDLLYRPKQGFSAPIGHWLKGPLHATARRRLLDGKSALAEFTDPASVERMLSEHAGGRKDWTRPLWACLVFERFLAREIGMHSQAA